MWRIKMVVITEEMATKGGVCPICGKFFKPNGVGPMDSKTLTTILNKIPSSSILRYGANYHDWAYHIGKRFGSRRKADMLMYQMNKIKIDKECNWLTAWYYHAANKRNYIFVRRFGESAYDHDGCDR